MERQLSISRLENESIFAFKAALDDMVDRGIQLVIIPGDFSSEGTMLNLRATAKILNHYNSEYGLRFFLACGNHDPRYPFHTEGEFNNMLGKNGESMRIISHSNLTPSKDSDAIPSWIHKDLAYGGYAEVIRMFGKFGFLPDPEDYYWETPFSKYGPETYSYEKGRKSGLLKNRTYTISGSRESLVDTSYLVEPVKGLWLLSIDANVYLPTRERGGDSAITPRFQQSGGAGYNEVMRHKEFLIPWMDSVARRAKESGKTLISFSHYPMLEYCEGETHEISRMLERPHMITVPSAETGNTLANTGIGLHFGGHVHTNGTATHSTPEGKILIDIQVPSTAGYPPEYKTLGIKAKHEFQIKTIAVNCFERVSEFFDLYAIEHQYLA